MRVRTGLISLGVAVAAGVLVVAAWSGGFAAPRPLIADKRSNAMPVDVELVIAVDVSNSMDPEEQELQRDGYVMALTSPEFLQALRSGAHGKVAITYFEWAGQFDQTILMPWRLIDGPEAADAVAREIARGPFRRAPRTSIYGALQFAKPLFDASGYRGFRQVIDVSGDGVNNMGPPVTQMRDDVLAAGITINGLPIMLRRQSGYGMWGMAFENLDIYYEDCVIGGPGSFVIAIKERDQFKEATRNKLVQEVAGTMPQGRVVPAQGKKPRVYCS
jgi:Protein of unknown function (DUF1194)